MTRTLFARITDLSQYQPQQREIHWHDENPKRWERVYALLKPRDRAIFVGKGKVYIGTIDRIEWSHRIVACVHVAAYSARVDDLLRVHALEPELMSRMKGMFVPFVVERELNIEVVAHALANEELVRFHVFADTYVFDQESNNDRIGNQDRVLVMQHGRFGPIRIFQNGQLHDFPGSDLLRARGHTPEEICTLLASNRDEGGTRSTAVALARRMAEALERFGQFTFGSFNGYHNTLYNKRAYGRTGSASADDPAPEVEEEEEEEAELADPVPTHPLNQILYGPPGTGKTHRTVDSALEILGISVAKLTREQRKTQFDRYVEDGRVVFCTFHQSLGYEDFIEGIKPVAPASAGGAVSYRVEPGIFRSLCLDAGLEVALRAGKVASPEKVRTLSVDERQRIGQTLCEEDYQRADLPPFVLVIDEINRANVSQVFGELITLLEDDKRLGRAEQLTVTLPYSKECFGVPPNVFVIGTMNTADRSVEALDTALRRRFEFTLMPPDSDVLDDLQSEPVCGYKPSALMDAINARIELLLGRDYLIGHAYFIRVSDPVALKACFCKKILPLLAEYFYGDPGRIGLVLGRSFVRLKHGPGLPKVRFASIDYDAGDLDQARLYEIVPEDEIDIEKAVAELMRGIDTHAGAV